MIIVHKIVATIENGMFKLDNRYLQSLDYKFVNYAEMKIYKKLKEKELKKSTGFDINLDFQYTNKN